MGDSETPTGPSSFQDAGGVKVPSQELRRNQEMHPFDPETSLETRAVCSQSKIKGLQLTSPLVPSISLASTFRINKIEEYTKCLKVSIALLLDVAGPFGNIEKKNSKKSISEDSQC